MLTEARDLAAELGDAETETEAMAWRVPTFVALCDLESAARARSASCARWPSAPRSRSCTTSPSTTARRSRSATGDLAEAEAMAERSRRVEPAADRARRLGHLRDPDVRHPPRAGPAGRAGAGDPDPRRRGRSRVAPGGPGWSRCWPSSGWRARRAASSRARRGGDRRLPDLAVAGLAHLPDRRLRGARRRGDGGDPLPRAGAAGRQQRDDRPPGRLLRRRRPLPRDARRDARRDGAGRAGTSSGRWS